MTTDGPVRLLAVAGSTRSGSFNKKLAVLAAETAEAAGARVTRVDLRDFPLPLYDADLEERSGLPAPARELKRLLAEQDAVLIATPEYNRATSGVLKNAIDWVSRAETEDEPPLVAFHGKVFGLVSASPGPFGGHNAVTMLRTMLYHMGVLVIPDQFSLPRAHEAFDEEGRLKEPRRRAALEDVVRRLVAVAARLRGV